MSKFYSKRVCCIILGRGFGDSTQTARGGWRGAQKTSLARDLLSTSAASETVRVRMAGVSRELTSGIKPWRDTRPYVGFRPTTPQYAAGFRVEPPVSEPRALQQIDQLKTTV